MKKFITDQSREMTAAVDMIGFIQIVMIAGLSIQHH